MKLIIIGMFVALMALGTSCAQVSQPVAEVAPQGTSDGIKVHGDWTVTVTNPDGTVDTVHEFENDLTSIGSGVITALLMEQADVEKWTISMQQPSPVSFSCVGLETFGNGVTSIPASVYRAEVEGNPIWFSGACTVNNLLGDTGLITNVGVRASTNLHIKINNKIGVTHTKTPKLTTHDLDIEVSENQSVSFNISLSFE